MLLSLRRYTTPSCLLGLAISHLLFESCAERLQLRSQKPDIAAHHAEMGNLLSLNPKIHRLRAHAKVGRSGADGERKVVNYVRRESAVVRESRGVHSNLLRRIGHDAPCILPSPTPNSSRSIPARTTMMKS